MTLGALLHKPCSVAQALSSMDMQPSKAKFSGQRRLNPSYGVGTPAEAKGWVEG